MNAAELCNRGAEPINNVIDEWAERLASILKNSEQLEECESLAMIITEMSCTKFIEKEKTSRKEPKGEYRNE